MEKRSVVIALCCLSFVSGANLALPLSAQQRPAPATAPQVGSSVPPFSGIDQFGKTETLQSVLGPKGAMLVFFRSADW